MKIITERNKLSPIAKTTQKQKKQSTDNSFIEQIHDQFEKIKLTLPNIQSSPYSTLVGNSLNGNSVVSYIGNSNNSKNIFLPAVQDSSLVGSSQFQTMFTMPLPNKPSKLKHNTSNFNDVLQTNAYSSQPMPEQRYKKDSTFSFEKFSYSQLLLPTLSIPPSKKEDKIDGSLITDSIHYYGFGEARSKKPNKNKNSFSPIHEKKNNYLIHMQKPNSKKITTKDEEDCLVGTSVTKIFKGPKFNVSYLAEKYLNARGRTSMQGKGRRWDSEGKKRKK